MRNWLQDKSRSVFAFLLVAGLVAGGLGWATAAALSLERDQWQARAEVEQANKQRLDRRERDQQERIRRREDERQKSVIQEEFAGRLRLALWRLDSWVAPVLAREDARPYNHFRALFTPSLALDRTGCVAPPGMVFEPSPLLNAELPDWMLLHFQTTPQSAWGSPQVLSATQDAQLRKNSVPLANVDAPRKRILAELASAGTATTLVEMLRREEARLSTARPAFSNYEGPEVVVTDNQAPGQNKGQKDVNKQRIQEMNYGRQQVNQSQFYNPQSQQPYNENAYSVYSNTVSGPTVPLTIKRGVSGSADQVLVAVGPMLPLWLPADNGRAERLVFARRVRLSSAELETWAILGSVPPGLPVNIAVAPLAEFAHKPAHPRELCQGIVLDWPRLRDLLAAEVRDLFPEARIVPLRSEAPAHPERTMTMLPVELEPGTVPKSELPQLDVDWYNGEPVELQSITPPELGWTPLRIGLVLAWAAALVALFAVALGGWSLIDLSLRRIRFVSAVTHELRTPLTTLRLYLDMLTGGMVQDEERRREYLQTLNTESDRLTRLVNNVLDLSRLENQRPRLELATIAVADVLDQVRSTWQSHCQDVGKELIVENILAEEAALDTDLHLVEQVLGNLIDNACKYSKGAEDVRLWLRARRGEKGRLWLEVEDRGPGIPPREQRSIFRAFTRGRDVEVLAGGVGLGLALAQRWASLLGGRLSLCCAQTGACFRLELPMKNFTTETRRG